jgi:hypothetical protein
MMMKKGKSFIDGRAKADLFDSQHAVLAKLLR